LIRAVAVLAVVAGGSLIAKAEVCKTSEEHSRRFQAVAARLGLSDEQKKTINDICTDFSRKEAPFKKQLRTLSRERHEAMSKVLTAEQRGKVGDAIREYQDKKWQATATKLKLTAEQRQWIDKTREEYRKRFRDLAASKDRKQEQFRKLERQRQQAIERELNSEQRASFRRLVRAESRAWRNPAVRSEFWKAIGEKLSFSAEQKEQLEKVRRESARKMAKPASQLARLRREHRAAVNKVLTEEQRTKLQQMRKHRSQENPNEKG
jgi:hypothetical protein